ncbi:hypothetical protein M9194_15145 [Vibrio sp. S4M6]|uniref:hypothetical protein n=1 Tax=Vibrio sinus TaxID=2946865 RepID=UPI00202AA5E3|nr:hypothetical protein [Vibrio sinus]MCL9782770.1 hypothetical protein [Vibrio sinus]
MLTKDVSNELESIIESLVNQGKKPTVALVKTRLTTPIPMPAIIATIKTWQSSQRVPKVEVAANETLDKMSMLEQQVLSLTQRIAELEAQLETLINKEK